jgi:dipeptidyl aminopeptidase/acylaminoacyl peptidase
MEGFMKNANESPREWLKLLSGGAVLLLITLVAIIFTRIDIQPIAPGTELAYPSETSLPYPQPTFGEESTTSGYPPPITTVVFVATETPQPTPEWVLLDTDEWGILTTPLPTLGPPRVVTHEPGPIDAVIPLVTPAPDARGTLIYFVQSDDRNGFTVQAVELGEDAQALSDSSLIATPEGIPQGWIHHSPNGSRVAITIPRGPTYLLDTFSGQLFAATDILPMSIDVFFNWHPNNTDILFINGENLFIGNIVAGYYTMLIEATGTRGNVEYASISPDGQSYVYVGSDDLDEDITFLVSVDGQEVYQAYSGEVGSFSWSPNGQLVAFYGERGIVVLNAEDIHPLQVAETHIPQCFFSPPLWSPDSQMLAVVVDRGDGRAFCDGWSSEVFVGTSIFLVDITNGTIRPLLAEDSFGNIDPSWSPDGRYIIFVSNRSGAPEVWVAAVDGSELRQLTHAGQYVRFPFWRWP